jgi:hypothetical protein
MAAEALKRNKTPLGALSLVKHRATSYSPLGPENPGLYRMYIRPRSQSSRPAFPCHGVIPNNGVFPGRIGDQHEQITDKDNGVPAVRRATAAGSGGYGCARRYREWTARNGRLFHRGPAAKGLQDRIRRRLYPQVGGDVPGRKFLPDGGQEWRQL